ncbi:hypothetical protein SAMN02910298_00228 [Pseudobutyrivibrio sp. YE44]|uniref:hypothetical protein n=1 Tax=Pseudobutyrivibrio sp. YE44 TaxID=1520802 RepID=UPI000884E64B|nr:hypothetical protein [Pseudobutyrivibrio sp. YE44]SDB07191.1 hypothetical protein SAMN02910298_00228 [Pseudobutyrivibrio sp. YE44]
MKKNRALIITLTSSLLIGCGQTTVNSINDVKEDSQTTEDIVNKEEQTDIYEDSTDGKNLDDVYLQYKDILFTFMESGILPMDDRDIEAPAEEMNTVLKYSSFAVADIDNDDIDELIVYFDDACMAGMVAVIYDYLDGQAKYKFMEFPNLSIYENGTIEAGWSHNQGYAGAFWPYNLYYYNSDSDEYIEVGSVDAYDKDLYECNKEVLDSSGSSFPAEADIDGNGFVYYIYENGLEDYQKIAPVDDDVYQDWLNQYTDGLDKISLDFYRITNDTVERLGDKAYFESLKKSGSDLYVAPYY